MARSTLWKHRKFRRLVMALKSKPLAVGLLECLWSCGYESGDDLIGTSEEVEAACGWTGKRNTLTPLLEEIGWIDATSEGYRIHDLYDHAPQYVKRRQTKETERRTSSYPLASQRLAKSYTEASQKLAKSYPQASSELALPNTNPTPTPTPTTIHTKTEKSRLSVFDEFWQSYPKKIARGPASVAWVELGCEQHSDAIMAALVWQRRQDDWTKDGGRYIPTPERYLRDQRWQDQPTVIHSEQPYRPHVVIEPPPMTPEETAAGLDALRELMSGIGGGQRDTQDTDERRELLAAQAAMIAANTGDPF